MEEVEVEKEKLEKSCQEKIENLQVEVESARSSRDDLQVRCGCKGSDDEDADFQMLKGQLQMRNEKICEIEDLRMKMEEEKEEMRKKEEEMR